jgi:ABC-2 type transport system permease protein
MAVTEFRRTYFGTVLGYVWSLVRPLMLFAVLLFVFTKVVRIGGNVPHYPVLLLLNIVIFTFFTESTNAAVTSVVTQEGIVRKTQFPRLVIPTSVVLTSLFNLCLNLVIVFTFILIAGDTVTWTWLLFPVAVLALTIFTTAISMIVSVLYVRFRDVAIIWGVFAQVLFYASPVLYPASAIPETYRRIIFFNPMSSIFQLIRKWVINHGANSPHEVVGGWIWLIPAIVIYIGVCVLAVWLFNRDAPRIAEEL